MPVADVQGSHRAQMLAGSEHHGPFPIHNLYSKPFPGRVRELEDAVLAREHPISAHDAASGRYDFTTQLVYLEYFELIPRLGCHVFRLPHAVGDWSFHQCGVVAPFFQVQVQHG